MVPGAHSPPRDPIAVSPHQPGALKDRGVDVALWILCVDVLAAITWNSLGTPPAAFSAAHVDKLLHLVSYLTLTLLLLLVAVWRPGRGPTGSGDVSKIVLAGVMFFGVLIEAAQGLLFERTADIMDAVANLTGILLAWLLWLGLRRMGQATR